ncbi:amino acid adenylation domain-containing protein [Actinoplanes sp. NPDC049118]|uniref:amino acid adenylation domain-containing protein n=1 Tax=Actinoplanes sp. NPDC049118 TaxID=3155769 RepID=UPI0033C68717
MRTLVDEIEAHAAADPDRVAVRTPDTEVSYGELAERIRALAAVLRERGARPERVCAVALERGVDAVVAVAAVIRSGAAFLTLDVEAPPARLAGLVGSAGAEMVVTTTTLAERLELPIPGPVVLLDEQPVAASADRSRWDPQPSSLAYVSHTSGSTGEPSAVLIEHRGMDSYLRFVARDYGLGERTVALQVAPQGYDASIRDTFAPLLAGGQLVLAPRSVVLRPSEFADAVRRYGVNTLLSVTPSFLSFLAGQSDPAGLLDGIGLVVSSGESLRPFLNAGGRSLIRGELINQYGPTECTMTSTRHRVPEVPDITVDTVGSPIDAVVVRLFAAEMTPVADGAVGEVYLGGAGVARGYHGDPVRTAHRFVPDPCGPPGSRLYRTGDLARQGPDGLRFEGRCDRQLKIRGYRVDPAEVEGALLRHPAVTEAVVTGAFDDRGRGYLIAHVIGDLAATTDGALRAHLAGSLPPHLLPRRFVRLGELPRNRSGKTDRRALAEVTR